MINLFLNEWSNYCNVHGSDKLECSNCH
uniref:Uncharacterized protein n=1 Tax=Heterorhabditis bacteriophora TaxID=37862 RepID=A0A1I7X2R9_HETBA